MENTTITKIATIKEKRPQSALFVVKLVCSVQVDKGMAECALGVLGLMISWLTPSFDVVDAGMREGGSCTQESN